MMCFTDNARRDVREFFPPEGYGLWCRIEDLGILCGFDPATRFDVLLELPDAYPLMSGRDPDAIAEEHPIQALAMLIRRFTTEYPEAAKLLAEDGSDSPKAA